ncbi:MAG TPA: PilZ domain-containing protein [bacterium]|jgi:Tfp pilus assembly protein PilZ|nr:hypothetical protein [Myxococcales bacterium]OQA61057.1 MAG: PilZ domain protein [bacterium ADurb.Bin270]HPW44945.1 PilZ domain-containing protein [bacterium]HQC50965.1 PilZ domain-containing protein [bacterium]HQG13231.1 PilZ domain-containing protein [bacterium]
MTRGTLTKIAEKRIHQRRPHRTQVVFEDEFGEGLFYVYSMDISMGGLFLESDIPLKIGTMLFLSFALPGHRRPVRVTGKVVRRSEGRGGRGGGLGISFLGLSELAMKRLWAFLKV